MRGWLLGLVLVLGSLPVLAQSTNPVSGYCDLGGSKAQVSGLGSTNYQQGDIPGCTIAVYLHGTQSLATIYSDSNNTPLANPFTAVVASSPNAGFYIFWAATGQGYDVVASGGTAPNSYPAPQTIKEVFLGGGGGGGGSPCGTVNDVQTNAGGGNFGCDSGFLYNTASNHTLYQNIFSAMLKVLVSDVTHSGLVTWGASNGTSITNTYSTGVNATLAATYGEAVPDNAPTAGQVRVVNTPATPVNGLIPTHWGTPVGAISEEFLYPLFSTNSPSPTTTSDQTKTLFAQGVSLPFQGPPPSGIQSSNIVQFAPYQGGPACSIGSVGTVTCQLPGPSTPGDIIYVVAGAVTGISTTGTFAISDSATDSYTVLDYVSGTLVGTLPSTNAYTVVPAGQTAPITVTVTATSSCGGTCIATGVQVFEINSGTLDVHDTGTSITGKTISCPSITTTHNPDVLLCSAFAYSNPAQTYAAGSATYTMVDTLTQAGASSNSLTIGTEAGNITTPAATVATMTASQSSLLTNFAVAFKTGSTAGSQTPTFRPRYYYDVASEQSWGFDVGAADAYVVGFAGCPATITSQPPTVVSFVPANANATTTPTLNYCNTGATTIKKRGSSGLVAVAANDMITSLLSNLTYNGTYWVLGNPVAASGVGVTFDEIGSGTNTTATMTCGTGCSITVSGSGSNNATKFDGNSTIAIANGGTAATTAAVALINLFPAASEVGDLVYCATFATGACTSWALLAGNTSGTKYLQETLAGAPSWTTPAGAVTSFTGDSVVLNNSGSTGAVTATLATHTANTFLAGPTSGSSATPTFRAQVNADSPPKSVVANFASIASAAIPVKTRMSSAGTFSADFATVGSLTSTVNCDTNQAGTITYTLVDCGTGTGCGSPTTFGTAAITNSCVVTFATTSHATQAFAIGDWLKWTPSGTDASGVNIGIAVAYTPN